MSLSSCCSSKHSGCCIRIFDEWTIAQRFSNGHIPQVPAGGGDGGQEADYGDEGDDGGEGGMGGLG